MGIYLSGYVEAERSICQLYIQCALLKCLHTAYQICTQINATIEVISDGLCIFDVLCFAHLHTRSRYNVIYNRNRSSKQRDAKDT